MSQEQKTPDRRVINWPDAKAPDFGKWDTYPAAEVKKIVLGPSPGTFEAKPLRLDLAQLAEHLPQFTNLTHLYLWQIEGLETLPTLPPGLECLDVRGCKDLASLPELPSTLETLVLDGCIALKDLASLEVGKLHRLEDLSLKGCAAIPEIWVQSALRASPALCSFDASECPQLVRLLIWPANLDRIELNGCGALRALPATWPQKLRRLGLRGAVSLARLPNLPNSIDHVDLASTEGLRELPARWGRPRTLFLHRSGILMPPASEHGRSGRENVAARTRAYFDDVALVGRGEVKRCKLLLLGNGDSGKTCLALRLVPPVCKETGYQDQWRPLQYWLDLIDLACPHHPRVAIVCSHRPAKTDELEARWRSQVTSNHHEHPCFYIDSYSGGGQVAELERWLCEAVGEVVHTQGVVVPSYWEIAQELVASWFPKPQPGVAKPPAPKHKELHPDRFREELEEAIRQGLSADSEQRYAQLAEARRDGKFNLTPDRIHWTLDFLTHSGWVYWDRELFQQRVIIGQQWALDGIYTALDRRKNSSIYRELYEAGGQFTRKNLDDWVWNGTYTEAEQRLLISFMKAVGVCFELVTERDSWWREPVFKSFEHLPQVEKLHLQRRFDLNLDPVCRSVGCAHLHKGHWQTMLKELGEYYGTDADYAADGFYVENKEQQVVCLLARFNKENLGGEILVQVAGPEGAERADALVTWVQQFLPEAEEVAPKPGAEGTPGSPPARASGRSRCSSLTRGMRRRRTYPPTMRLPSTPWMRRSRGNQWKCIAIRNRWPAGTASSVSCSESKTQTRSWFSTATSTGPRPSACTSSGA